MNIRILCLTSLLCCSPSLSMDNKQQQQLPQLPQAKKGFAALFNWGLKKAGLQEVKTDETIEILTRRAQLIKENEYTVHQLMQHPDVYQFAHRAADREHSINVQLLAAMAANNTESVRDLYILLTGNMTVQDMAKKYIDEETQANQKTIDTKGK